MPTDAELDLFEQLHDSLEDFGAECLRIRTKAGQIVPFVMNAAQRQAHDRIEEQRAEKGWVRALILKGRQQGMSTYIGARYYHKSSMNRGVNVYILSHEQNTSDALFKIVDRYQRNNPLAPHVGASNVKELEFDRLESSYAVATAGAKEGGRGRTISLFHGSEVAFWMNAPGHFAASVQAVPLEPGTEVLLESTSAGPSGEFYERWQDAEAGKGDYICIFIPWFVSPEYARQPPPGFELSKEADDGEFSEVEYAQLHDLSLAQMCWRRNKIVELRSLETFKREYPSSPDEAWTATGTMEPYIKPANVMRARKRKQEAAGPLILGVDPASGGGDRFAVAARRGLVVPWVKWRNKIDTHEGTLWVKSLIDEYNPARVNVDAGNIGAAIITNLKALGPKYAKVVRGVNFGAPSQAKVARPKVPGPKNRRAEMWMRSKDWLELEEGVQIPDLDVIQGDATGPMQKPLLNNDFLLESKADMKKRRVRSPDLWDSVVLTFASLETLTGYHEAPSVRTFGNLEQAAPKPAAAVERPRLPTGPTGWMA